MSNPFLGQNGVKERQKIRFFSVLIFFIDPPLKEKRQFFEKVILFTRRSARERNKIDRRFEEERNKITRSFGGERNKFTRSFRRNIPVSSKSIKARNKK